MQPLGIDLPDGMEYMTLLNSMGCSNMTDFVKFAHVLYTHVSCSVKAFWNSMETRQIEMIACCNIRFSQRFQTLPNNHAQDTS